MFGNKLRAWMESVRPKRKQYRKDKQGKGFNLNSNGSNSHNHHTVTWQTNPQITNDHDDTRNETKSRYTKNHCRNGPTNSHLSRYSANNLSSPESAYSTGYSTDGTSPGAPPDYLLNTSRKTDVEVNSELLGDVKLNYPGDDTSDKCLPNSRPNVTSPLVIYDTQGILGKKTLEIETKDCNTVQHSSIFSVKVTEGTTPMVMSPRQRNRIRTNPWLPSGTSSATPTPLPVRQEIKMTPVKHRSHKDSPLSPAKHRRSLSSSSCSSLSGAVQLEHHFQRSLSDEEDCTLNEMMGKYDESYVYEKETDILSDDSDQTDCESDIDTGQDGGDEDDTADAELDFIDNGSYLEVDCSCKLDNTGHCFYFVPLDVHRKRSSRKRNKRTKDGFSQKRKPANKKCHHRHFEKIRHSSLHHDGSQSAGATPVSVRRSNLEHCNLETFNEDYIKKRSNSVCVQKDCSQLIEKRDKEADMKYRELIGQAEQILRTMNINGLSPRRLPTPANKRIELLKSTECAKAEVPKKPVKPIEDILTESKGRSNVTLKNSRFSPKKNHITNFIINNSPILLKKELQGHSPLVLRRNLNEESPLATRKYPEPSDTGVLYRRKVYTTKATNKPNQLSEVNVIKKSVKEYDQVAYSSPVAVRRTPPKSILHKNEDDRGNNHLSPRHRRTNKSIVLGSSSSEEEEFQKARKKLSKSCPQSEPVKRKVYFGRNTINLAKMHGKTVAFNLQGDSNLNPIENNTGSAENLRQQVLLNTIQSLKRNLENQSAFLQQHYRSTQNMYKYTNY